MISELFMNMKRCTGCKETKPIECFGYLKRSQDGRAYRCKECAKLYKQKKEEGSSYFNLYGATEEDYETMFLLLQRIGYDIFGDVSQQFCDKWNLKYKKRGLRYMNKPFANEILKKLKRNN